MKLIPFKPVRNAVRLQETYIILPRCHMGQKDISYRWYLDLAWIVAIPFFGVDGQLSTYSLVCTKA